MICTRFISSGLILISAAAVAGLAGCAPGPGLQVAQAINGEEAREAAAVDGSPTPAAPVETTGSISTPDPAMGPGGFNGPHGLADAEGPYLLDSGDRLRVFVYGQPNLSRGYTVDHDGRITVPLIGHVEARGRTTSDLERMIRKRLATTFVRDPEVTVDMVQNRPFFILGEVRAAGQYPYVSGMTVETAIAIAGGYSERASERSFRITRRLNGFVEEIEAPSDYVVRPGDTVYVYERFF
jgi:polysaccharide export outer membrane protein